MLVEWSYRGSWVIGEAVDAIPDDMTRKGIRITSEIDAKDRGTLEAQLDELQVWDALNDVLKWSRLYGGAVGFIMWLLSLKAEPEIVVQLETETQWQIKRKAGGPAGAESSSSFMKITTNDA